MRTIILVISMVYMASPAAADQVETAKAAVLGKLKDPESARFRNIRSVGDQGAVGEIVCGEVNARNAMGGYVGFRKFHYSAKVAMALIPGDHGMTDDPLDSISRPSDRFCK